MSEIKKLNETFEHETDQSWATIYQAKQGSLILESIITGMETRLDKLCAVVYVGEVRGYIPMDFFGVDDAHEMRQHLGQVISYKIVNYDREGETFVASRLEAKQHEMNLAWKRLKEGMETTAVVRVVHRKSLLAEVSGIDVRLPVEDFGYGWYDDLRDEVETGDELRVGITECDPETEKLVISKKLVEKNPWPNCTKRFQKYGEYVGVVSGVAEYGLFIRLEQGVDALVHHDRFNILKKGTRVLIRIMRIDLKKENINGKITKVLR